MAKSITQCPQNSLDGTIANKTRSTPQVNGYLENRPKGVVYIVKPHVYGPGKVIRGPQGDAAALPKAVQNPVQPQKPGKRKVR